MTGLATLAGILAGGAIGAGAGIAAAFAWSDWDSFDALAWIIAGGCVGAAAGGSIAAEIVT